MRALFVILLFCSALCLADPITLEYLYSPNLDEKNELLQDRVYTHARNGEFDFAMTLSQTLLDDVEPLRETETSTYGQILINHGIIHSASGEYELGLSIVTRGLEFVELRTNPFSRSLINGIMAKGLTESNLGMLVEAEDTFRRAQHVTHRQGGVYTQDQLPIIDHLTATHLKQGRTLAADREQLFTLRISEQVYGPDSIELLPSLNRLGNYFATRGSSIPILVAAELRMQRDSLFKYSVNMYQRSVMIIEQTYGENDLRLVQPLRGLASARMLQVTSRKHAQAALTRSLEIVESNPDSDISDRANAMIDLGDLYTITSDTRAAAIYLEAWHLMQETPQMQLVANSAFATPVRLFPRGISNSYLNRLPDGAEPGDQLFVELEYSVTAEGKVNSVSVIERNVPNENVRLLRKRLRSTRFRPRIEDGELLATEGLSVTQTFKLRNRRPVLSNSAASTVTNDEVP